MITTVLRTRLWLTSQSFWILNFGAELVRSMRPWPDRYFVLGGDERLLHVWDSVESGWWRDGDGSWWAAAKGRVRPSRIVRDTPDLGDDLRFPEAVEDIAIEQYVPELTIERFTKAILPR
jgi:hypothetical protein